VDEKEAHPTFSLQQKPLKTEYRGENATGVPISRKNDFTNESGLIESLASLRPSIENDNYNESKI